MARLKDYKGQVINPTFLEKGGPVKTFDELVDRFASFITMNATQLRAGINRHIKRIYRNICYIGRPQEKCEETGYNRPVRLFAGKKKYNSEGIQ